MILRSGGVYFGEHRLGQRRGDLRLIFGSLTGRHTRSGSLFS